MKETDPIRWSDYHSKIEAVKELIYLWRWLIIDGLITWFLLLFVLQAVGIIALLQMRFMQHCFGTAGGFRVWFSSLEAQPPVPWFWWCQMIMVAEISLLRLVMSVHYAELNLKLKVRVQRREVSMVCRIPDIAAESEERTASRWYHRGASA